MSKFLCVNEMTAKQLRKIERSKIFRAICTCIFTLIFFPVVLLFDTIRDFYAYSRSDFDQ